MITLLLMALIPQPASAIEPRDPVYLCERFIPGPKQETCRALITKIQPDWYAAAVCGEMEDDSNFERCLKYTNRNFELGQTAACADSTENDDVRFRCLRSALKNESRQPASSKNHPSKSEVMKKAKKHSTGR